MSEGERKIADSRGRFLRAVKDGRDLSDADWQDCRLLLTTDRLAIVGDGRLTLPLADVDRFGDRYDVNQAAASVGEYAALHVDGDVVLVAATDHAAFETDLYRAVLDGAVVYANHPAVVGGVVQDVDWQRGRTKLTGDALRIVLEDGRKVTVDRDDIGGLTTEHGDVAGEQRAIVEVEHTEEGRSVETHLSGREQHISVLTRLLEEGAERSRADLDLDPVERRVVMALYSGVSPFAISDFVGVEVERVEEIYDRLLELDVIEVVRERTEVALTPQGRTVAGEAMGER
jgi:helix-turn-helix protein